MRRPFSSLQRWPLVRAQTPRAPHRAARFAAFGLAFALVLATALPLAPLLRVALGVAAIASFAVGLGLRQRAVGRPFAATGAFVEATPEGLSLVSDSGKKNLVPSWSGPLGVVLLASYGRKTALLAISAPTQTRFVAVRLDGKSDDDDATLAKITVLADLDLIDGVTHEAALSSTDAATLVRCVAERCPEALGRIYSNDGRRMPIALDRAELVVGERRIDLTSAFEWRPLMFHESTGQAAPLFQATWIRQAALELVLVAPMPASILPRDASAKDVGGRVGHALTRDLRLLQAQAEPPPPRDVRVPIDRPFMLVVRRALSEAPLAVRTPSATGARTSAERRSPLA